MPSNKVFRAPAAWKKKEIKINKTAAKVPEVDDDAGRVVNDRRIFQRASGAREGGEDEVAFRSFLRMSVPVKGY